MSYEESLITLKSEHEAFISFIAPEHYYLYFIFLRDESEDSISGSIVQAKSSLYNKIIKSKYLKLLNGIG